MNFIKKLDELINKNNSLLCVGLDTNLSKIPQYLLKAKDPIFEFNKAIIDATHDLVCAYKPQIAYYEAAGIDGLKSLKKTVDYIKKNYPEVPIICDAKRADIGSTSKQYAISLFDNYDFDAVTVNPYLGFDGLEPFMEYKDKGIIILCRTSNPGAADFQDIKINGKPFYLRVAEKIVEWNKKYNNCLMVVGSTWPEEMKKIREMAPNMFFLVPGTGTQGGDLENTIKNGLTKDKSGLIISVSRAIIYASKDNDFAEKAREKSIIFKDEINKHR